MLHDIYLNCWKAFQLNVFCLLQTSYFLSVTTSVVALIVRLKLNLSKSSNWLLVFQNFKHFRHEHLKFISVELWPDCLLNVFTFYNQEWIDSFKMYNPSILAKPSLCFRKCRLFLFFWTFQESKSKKIKRQIYNAPNNHNLTHWYFTKVIKCLPEKEDHHMIIISSLMTRALMINQHFSP